MAGEDEPAAAASAPSAPAAKASPDGAKRKSRNQPPPETDNSWILTAVVVTAIIGAVAALVYFQLTGASAHELTGSTWDAAVEGKAVFVKFYAPWCGHCKKMKPAWDKLMSEYVNSSAVLVADVDCIGAGKSLCELHKVRSFPTLKYGDPQDLQDYTGGRSLEDMRKFTTTLEKLCRPDKLEFCTEEQKAKVSEYTAMDAETREQLIKESEDKMEKLEADFKEVVSQLNKQYAEEQQNKDARVRAVKDNGLSILKAIRSFERKSKSSEL